MMSKTQEKRAARKAEQQAFIRARREMQIAQWENNLEIGERIYSENKEKLSQEEIEILDKQLTQNRELLAKLKDDLDSLPKT
jgi:hypothetical protein